MSYAPTFHALPKIDPLTLNTVLIAEQALPAGAKITVTPGLFTNAGYTLGVRVVYATATPENTLATFKPEATLSHKEKFVIHTAPGTTPFLHVILLNAAVATAGGAADFVQFYVER